MLPDECRALLQLTMLAAYDRKVEREFFASLITAVSDAHKLIGDIENDARMMNVLYLAAQAEEREPDYTEIQKIMDAHGKELKAIREKIVSKFDLISQCPTSVDKIS